MACSPQEVQTNATAFMGQPEPRLLGMLVYLTAEWAKTLNPGLDVTPQGVITASECYTCGMSWKALYGAMVYLLCQISENGGGGGSNVFSVGSGSPEGVVTGNPGDRYGDSGTGTLYTKFSGTGNTGWQVG